VDISGQKNTHLHHPSDFFHFIILSLELNLVQSEIMKKFHSLSAVFCDGPRGTCDKNFNISIGYEFIIFGTLFASIILQRGTDEEKSMKKKV
jgi:hypothetical protein